VGADEPQQAERTVTRRSHRVAGIALRTLSYLWLLALLLGLWEWRGQTHPSLFIPPPSEIVTRAREIWFSGSARNLFTTDEFRLHVGASLRRWAVGYGLAAVGGVVIGTVLARNRRANLICQPLIRLAQSTPSIMLLPVAIVLLGINSTMTTSVIVYAAIWPVLVNTIDGVANVDAATLNSARAMRISGFSLFRLVLLPAASPQILTGLRVALGVSIILMIGSELYAATEGVGVYIMLAQRTLRFTDMFAGILLAALIGLAANALFQLAERRVTRWRPKTTGE
jgi:ABC-type nitrate/sulfonate/bicarbonate transport system permease component